VDRLSLIELLLGIRDHAVVAFVADLRAHSPFKRRTVDFACEPNLTPPGKHGIGSDPMLSPGEAHCRPTVISLIEASVVDL
jgi:hypothetical protein